MAVASPPEGDLPRWAPAAAARHFSWAAGRSPGPGVLRETASLRRIVRSFAPDVVHLHSAKAGLAGRLALRGRIPTLFQPHAWSFLAVTGPVARAALRWERFAARWADAIVCVSRAERDQGVAAGVSGAWEIVPNGVDLDRFTPGDAREARQRLGEAPGPLAVCVGRLSRQKGQDVLLRAWSDVGARVPEARLVLVGGGPDEAELRAAAPSGVSFAGVSDDVVAWLAAADVVVVPSRWEGMSLSMLEALAAGRSVVATDVSGAREAVTDDSGAVVAVEDAGALADALIERLEDPTLSEAEGRAARSIAEERFGLERNAQEMLRVYRDVFARRST